MKIVHVITGVGKNAGGVAEVVPRLCRAQKELGDDVTLVVGHEEEVSAETKAALASGVTFKVFPSSFTICRIEISPALRKGLVEIVRAADLVYIHGLWLSAGWYAAAECRRQKKPYVMMTHGFLEPERLKISKWKKRLAAFCFDRRNLKSAKAIVATSESEARGIRQYGLTNPIHIMPIGLDLEPFLPPIPHKGKTLLYFSRITPIKGLDMLAEAWANLGVGGRCRGREDWKLLLVGPDDRGYTEEIKKVFAAKCPPGSYEFRGPVFGAEKYKLLASVDAMVLPTRSENWSIAVAEGMAAGLPVVCTKGAPWSCLGENWVDISVEGITQGLERILSADDESRRKMGAKNRQWVKENLNWATIVRNLFNGILLQHANEYFSRLVA